MFSSHPKAIYWSNLNNIQPYEVKINVYKKFWFNCDKCCHVFDRYLHDVVIRNGWCPYCVNKKICDLSKNCKICFDKSFASVEYSKNWSELNEINPEEIFTPLRIFNAHGTVTFR